MKTVGIWEDIRKNLLTLEMYRSSQGKKERSFYQDRIRHGVCFVALETDSGFIFGPSRFVGYISNDLHRHQLYEEKDGRVTNRAIDRILGPHAHDKGLENEFLKFCHREGITPDNKTRKYWHRRG